MLDEILRFAFWAVVESTFFRVGCWVVRVLSPGNVTVTSRKPIVTFVVSLLGLATALAIVVTFVTVARWFLAAAGRERSVKTGTQVQPFVTAAILPF